VYDRGRYTIHKINHYFSRLRSKLVHWCFFAIQYYLWAPTFAATTLHICKSRQIENLCPGVIMNASNRLRHAVDNNSTMPQGAIEDEQHILAQYFSYETTRAKKTAHRYRRLSSKIICRFISRIMRVTSVLTEL